MKDFVKISLVKLQNDALQNINGGSPTIPLYGVVPYLRLVAAAVTGAAVGLLGQTLVRNG
ncbi:MAG: hypothetical protein JW881_01710 [Spirochaetales bacterium]|nr:hypothetical protein [Spirochaetales bacterium]